MSRTVATTRPVHDRAFEPAGEPRRRTLALSRQLGLATATALVVAEVIGVGIFLTTAGMVKSLGSPFWLLAVWLTTGAAAAGGALCFGALAARRPEAGGPYVYLKEAYGPRVGLPLRLAVDAGDRPGHHRGRGGRPGDLRELPRAAFALGPERRGGRGDRGAGGGEHPRRPVRLRRDPRPGGARSSGCSASSCSGAWAWAAATGRTSCPSSQQRPGSKPLAEALIGGMIAAFFSLGGWWDVSKIAGEVRDPRRTLPRALLLGVALVTVVYVLISLVFLYLVPPERIDSREAFAALAGEALFGRAGGVVLSLIVIVTVAGEPGRAADGDAPRLLRHGARRAVLPRGGRAPSPVPDPGPRHRHPGRRWPACWRSWAPSTQILAYFVVPTVVFVVLTVAAVFVLRRRARAGGEPLSVPWHPLPPLLFLVPTAALLALMAIDKPIQCGIGLGVVLLGSRSTSSSSPGWCLATFPAMPRPRPRRPRRPWRRSDPCPSSILSRSSLNAA